MSNDKKWLLPLLLSCTLILGVFIGSFYGKFQYINKTGGLNRKLNDVMSLIMSKYVDTLSVDSLVEETIPLLMSKLDPHSVYIPAEDLVAVNSELEGSFTGIGVQFSILNDTVNVIDVISGGPSQKVGLLPGDQIVTIDDSLFVGKGVTNEKVFKRLRGPEGTSVKLGIRRGRSISLLSFEVRRGVIPVNSIDAQFIVQPGIGYIKVGKFGATTYNEFITALAEQKNKKCSKFIVDLRGNAGGYMDAAIRMVNEFLPGGRLIVYAEGKAYPRQDSEANGAGSFQSNPVVVLIDEWSASASEIFAGAIQDNDRGMIIGRRSYGKGLVQEQIPLVDGSALRLTVARYYIPSGRCIQKEYTRGDSFGYEEDIVNRYKHGEFFNQDSIKFNQKLRYETLSGRTVYGGGGIMPDIFVPRDTIGINSYYNKLWNKSLIYSFSFDFANANRAQLKRFTTVEEFYSFMDEQELVESLLTLAETKGVRRQPYLITESYKLIRSQLYSYVIRHIKGENMFYKSLFLEDPVLIRAKKELTSRK